MMRDKDRQIAFCLFSYVLKTVFSGSNEHQDKDLFRVGRQISIFLPKLGTSSS